jgi:putative tryptophan/tyrosine transport system substrate-binding protein
MRRRAFIASAASATAAWPLAASAQPGAMPVLGILQTGSAGGTNPGVAALLVGLREAGYVEGRNMAIEYRYADGQSSRLPDLAADLVRRRVAAIAGLGGSAPALAAKAATASIPIVFAAPQNPVELGLVDSIDRPGGNVTGIVGDHDELTAKRVGLLHELVLDAGVLGVLVNPSVPTAVASNVRTAQASANARGLQVQVLKAASERELDAAFAQLAPLRVGALLVAADVSFFNWRNQIVALATRHRIPTSYWRRDFVADGGLTSYGAHFDDLYRRAGVYIGRILKGEKPADLPVLHPTRGEFVLNLKAAKALGLDIPPKLHAFADEVIE